MSEILSYLNEEQQEAVKYDGRFLKINAGPGTGKTTTLAAKILYLQSELGESIDKILGISFSRSAKCQLLNKLEDFSDKIGYGGKPLILTFHSLAHRIIKYGINYKESIFRVGFRRMNTEDFVKLNPSIIKGLCVNYTNRTAVNKALSQAYIKIRQGNSLKSPVSHYNQIDVNETLFITTYEHGRILLSGKDLKSFWIRVNKLERSKNVTDYQGMITEAIRILQLKERTFDKFSLTYNHIFIDEYQDTSLAQEKLLHSLIGNHHNVTIVGDKNQTIYTFNGSNSENMNRFSKYFGTLDAANFHEIYLIQNYRSTNEVIDLANDFISEKNIIPYKYKPGFKPTIIETHSIGLAASYVAKKIKELTESGTYKESDICILYRKNSEFSPQGKSVFKELESHGILYKQQSKSKDSKSFLELINDIENEYEDELLEEVLLKLMEKDVDEKLIEFVKDVVKQGATEVDDLIDIAVDKEGFTEETIDNGGVKIKTVHDSKGLEYPVVFILYLGDKEFPHSSQPDIEEERRLFYVGITRAKEQLFILGRKGIHQESFLDKCLHSNIYYEKYNSSKIETQNDGLSEEEKDTINNTTEQLEEKEKEKQEELRKLMDLF